MSYCYKHSDKEATATCKRCGKPLCAECAAEYDGFCEDCYHAEQAKAYDEQQAAVKKAEKDLKEATDKYKDALIDTKDEFKKACIKGIVFAVIFGVLYLSNSSSFNFLGFIFVLIAGFAVPFGWAFISWVMSHSPFIVFGTIWYWIFWFWIKLCFSVFLGIPCFFYQLYKTKKAEKALKDVG